MFVQIIQGRCSDREGLARQFDRWQADLRPGADGFLGVTEGVTADGRAIALARFADEASARRNSERAEQGAWWNETEKCYEGEVEFAESTDVELFRAGGSDDAGFVQVMRSHDVDRDGIRELDAVFEQMGDFRPDLLGIVRVWTGDDSCVEAAYFRSEAEARAAEQQPLPDDVAAIMARLQDAMGQVEYFDLTEPHLA